MIRINGEPEEIDTLAKHEDHAGWRMNAQRWPTVDEILDITKEDQESVIRNAESIEMKGRRDDWNE